MKLTGGELDDAVRAAGQGDRAALTSVLESVQEPILRYCRGRIGIGERHLFSADDIAQEALMAVMTALPRYRDQGKPFMAFVYGITSHKVADAMRVAARVKSDPVEDVPEVGHVTGGPEQFALDADGSRRMRALLDILPEKQREVLVLRLVVGMSAEETAQMIGSTAGAVRVAQHRALAKLKDELKRTGGHDERRI
ncbi:sigma-70 family RNA polymerase sigma factor [Gordonia rubripertincta]|uniref:Sigma-70 family RNA polymerase sigma factor n=2 Tax=Gordonia TaxID=2053 RepID=A0AAW4G2N6_GORRU|nr:sigma-70 family RNA polymerase sigma factor [Gordonia rubripertincta]ASR02506.1 ECF RNA polymerase sigma factor SigD [Gordonia rubripertincta]MBM7277482.1 sigma-70 family RNA polymerase sigma factor [Gordonia rubripertincta]NKY63469.1 sigma-70 family RNA polymerase sigma factor [Gordonia rubripertincta]QMU20386.1 sigma-70 family RNA polymerase sigma factor [Gordonia rubripertincta]TSD96871.1 sigma-70 family RNA polymerase sigma factor [Gordonia rubripertincta]